MRVSNGELQSANEELRSTLEEFETSKEELQSINEELQTANEENRHKVRELSQLSDDLQHLMAATHIATLFLDRELRILRFTPQVGELFSLRAVDRGRPLSDLTHRLNYNQLINDAASVLESLIPLEREVQNDAGHWYFTRMRPYRTAADRIDGVVLTFVDITERKNSEQALRQSEERYRMLFESMDEGFCVVEEITNENGDRDFRVLEANRAFLAQTGLKQIMGRSLSQVDALQWQFWCEVTDRLGHQSQLARFEWIPDALKRWVEAYAFRLPDANGPHLAVLLKDITEQKLTDAALREASERDNFRIALADAVRTLHKPDAIQAVSSRLLAEYLQVDRVAIEPLSRKHKDSRPSSQE